MATLFPYTTLFRSAHSFAAKSHIVAADGRETQDIRALLNLGHSFGHALEAETGYSDRLLHGEAVAAGMVLAHQFSAAKGLCPAADAARVRDHLASLGLRSEEHTSELQSLMRISYAVFCLKTKIPLTKAVSA